MNPFQKLLATLEYNRLYKHMPDSFIYDEMYFLACLRNMKGLIVSDRGGMSSKYCTYTLPSDKLKQVFDDVWKDAVYSGVKRKYWAWVVDKEMRRILK